MQTILCYDLGNLNGVVFLLTSTIEPYIMTSLDVLCLPLGALYRVRYGKRWVPQNLLNKDAIKELKNKKAIIIHINVEKGNDKDRILEFIPIREAQISEVHHKGEFIHIEFKLGNWIRYHSAPSSEPNEFHVLFKNQIPNDDREFVNHLVFHVKGFSVETIPDDPSGENDEVSANWTLIVLHLAKLKAHANSIFLKIDSIKKLGSSEYVKPESLKGDVAGYSLKAGDLYELTITQFCPQIASIESSDLVLESDKEAIDTIQSRSKVRGKYDLLRFIISCKSVLKDVNTFLSVRLLTSKYRAAEPIVNVVIKGSHWPIYKAVGIFAAGISLTSLSIYLVDINAKITVSVIGAVLSTIGLWFLQRTH